MTGNLIADFFANSSWQRYDQRRFSAFSTIIIPLSKTHQEYRDKNLRVTAALLLVWLYARHINKPDKKHGVAEE